LSQASPTLLESLRTHAQDRPQRVPESAFFACQDGADLLLSERLVHEQEQQGAVDVIVLDADAEVEVDSVGVSLVHREILRNRFPSVAKRGEHQPEIPLIAVNKSVGGSEVRLPALLGPSDALEQDRGILVDDQLVDVVVAGRLVDVASVMLKA
jgi:hypothetical protein